MTRGALILGLALGLAGSARADDDAAQGAPRIDVAVGETVAREVGFAMGLHCDDLSILRVELRPSTPESNAFVVTGVREGTTLCRVGTALGRPSFVFEIHVLAPRPPR